MNAADFRRIALSLKGAEEGSHMSAPDFRVGGRIFATLASQDEGYGNLMLTPEQQADFVRELPEVFLPVRGGWGKMGATHIRLAKANEGVGSLVNQSETTEAQQIIFLLRFNNPISDAISSRIFKTSRYLVCSPITGR